MKAIHKDLLKTAIGILLIVVIMLSSMYLYFEGRLEDEIGAIKNTQVLENVIVKNEMNIQEVIQKASKSIVAITTTVEVDTFFSGKLETEGSGSGVIYETNDDGVYIITNHHVVDESKTIYIDFGLSELKEANVIGLDADADLAILLVKQDTFDEKELEEISVAKIGDNKELLPGDMAIAIGNGLGYGKTVTVGVVSALERDLGVAGNQLYSLIQTDAAINPGNSGGALINIYGEVIGINTIKIADTRVEGVGFAIPISDAIDIIEELKEFGYLSKPYIGITGQTVEEEVAEMYDVPRGVYIMEIIENSPAMEANLMEKDIIVSIDAIAVKSIEELIKEVRGKKAGDTVDIVVVRDGEEITVELELGKMDQES